MCISLKGYGWINEFVKSCGMKSFTADGNNVVDIFCQSRAAVDYARTHQKPSLILFSNLARRFGHAATDRQFAYLTEAENAEQENTNSLECNIIYRKLSPSTLL